MKEGMRILSNKPFGVQVRVLQILKNRADQNSMARLSLAELANILDVSRSSVQRALEYLERKKLIERKAGQSYVKSEIRILPVQKFAKL